MRARFDGWTTIQNNISVNHESIEFRRAGAIRFNLFNESLGKEKAVDVKLAIDLLMLREIYDTAVIVSGDQDYVPAVQAAKDFENIEKGTIILISDGIESCGGDIDSVAPTLEELGLDLKLHIVGFGIKEVDARKELEAIASSTKCAPSASTNK